MNGSTDWEWVWGPVGDAHPGVGYMHRPSSFPLVQFANDSGREPRCRNIEFPGRHVAKSIHLAQAQYARLHNGSYATKIATLLNSTLCNLDLGTSDTCDLDALEFAVGHPAVFKLGLAVTDNITQITRCACILLLRSTTHLRENSSPSLPLSPLCVCARKCVLCLNVALPWSLIS